MTAAVARRTTSGWLTHSCPPRAPPVHQGRTARARSPRRPAAASGCRGPRGTSRRRGAAGGTRAGPASPPAGCGRRRRGSARSAARRPSPSAGGAPPCRARRACTSGSRAAPEARRRRTACRRGVSPARVRPSSDTSRRKGGPVIAAGPDGLLHLRVQVQADAHGHQAGGRRALHHGQLDAAHQPQVVPQLERGQLLVLVGVLRQHEGGQGLPAVDQGDLGGRRVRRRPGCTGWLRRISWGTSSSGEARRRRISGRPSRSTRLGGDRHAEGPSAQEDGGESHGDPSGGQTAGPLSPAPGAASKPMGTSRRRHGGGGTDGGIFPGEAQRLQGGPSPAGRRAREGSGPAPSITSRPPAAPGPATAAPRNLAR